MKVLSPQFFGDKSSFAIEVNRLGFVDDVLCGNIVLWIVNHPIGRAEAYEDIGIGYTLLKHHFSDANDLVDDELDAMSAGEILNTVYRFGHDDKAPYDEIRSKRYYELEIGPAQADWWDPFIIITLQSGADIRFVWAVFSNRKICWDFRVSKVICDAVLKQFFDWFECS